MSSNRAVRIPVDASGNQIGKAQTPPGQQMPFKNILRGGGGSSSRAKTLKEKEDSLPETTMPITPRHSIRDLNEFLPAASFNAIKQLADELPTAVASADTTVIPISQIQTQPQPQSQTQPQPQSQTQSKLLGRRRENSLHGSEGTIETSNSEQAVADASADQSSATATATALPTARQSADPQHKQSADSVMSADSLINDEQEDNSLILDLAQFPEFSAILTSTYWGPMTQNSTTLDIIAVYLKGQKILYIDSKTHCENSLNILMMPTILISAICTVLSVAMKSLESGAILVSCLTGASTFILSIISFLKLDAKAQAHKTSAYQFDKLQTMCEFFSGKVLLIKDKDNETFQKVQTFVNEVEKKVEEIKDTNQFIIPEAVRFRYPYIYSTNVFSQIKKMKAADKAMKNQLYFTVKELDEVPINDIERRVALKERRNKLLDEIVMHHNNLFVVDKMVNEEINKYGTGQKAKHCYSLCNWFKV